MTGALVRYETMKNVVGQSSQAMSGDLHAREAVRRPPNRQCFSRDRRDRINKIPGVFAVFASLRGLREIFASSR